MDLRGSWGPNLEPSWDGKSSQDRTRQDKTGKDGLRQDKTKTRQDFGRQRDAGAKWREGGGLPRY